ncbi:response regulator [Flavobacterium sp. NST-5]|uniref:Response regulator n=1 Tax=Flavobacterium ichthyis TaxID=2698827 RepID=A0ABW9ZDN9_9FLAO|nr:response regulator [Flavobacterium ichthyis]NBL64888.1 response regulator [Flavobacterium ichthyis]
MKKFNDVIVVDDDKIYHFILKKLLKKSNIEVTPHFFENGRDAIEGLKGKEKSIENLPDLILLDINMPVMDGWQFLEEYKKIKSTLSQESVIYLISSSNNPVDIDKAKNFPDEVRDYFIKPVCLEDLCRIFLN